MQKINILVIEDEVGILDLITFKLEKEGYKVLAASNGADSLNLINHTFPDLILLDLMLPDMDGYDLCRFFKSKESTKKIPIIMLTAKDDESDVIAGLTLGADDYITKPFSPKILIARVKAALRRKNEFFIDKNSTIKIGKLSINIDQQRAFIEDLDINLTYAEFKVLLILVNSPGRVYTRGQIIEAIHDNEADVTDRSVDNLIVGIRKKLGFCSNYIETAWGAGYRFTSF